MGMKLVLFMWLSLFVLACNDLDGDEAQEILPIPQFTSYFTGNPTDKQALPKGGICLMGGAREDDNAMRWFLKQADGGDILVLRTSGSNGYNDYLYSELQVNVNSVESIVVKNKDASFDFRIHDKINKAEAIWFAGGNQWDYINFWQDTPIDSLINIGITKRNIVIGGTSAGMAILGEFVFNAKNGTITSSEALENPYHQRIAIDSTKFILTKYLTSVITDTHYSDRQRKGRHVTFMARIIKDWNINIRGIAADEYTAICFDSEGKAKVYGNNSSQDHNAYFIKAINGSPEICESNKPLTWSRDSTALQVYELKGTLNGTNYFNMNNWKSGSGGTWNYWFIINGKFHEKPI